MELTTKLTWKQIISKFSYNFINLVSPPIMKIEHYIMASNQSLPR